MLEKNIQSEMGRRAFKPQISRMLLFGLISIMSQIGFSCLWKRKESKVMRMQKATRAINFN
jgi:hypothetical protein